MNKIILEGRVSQDVTLRNVNGQNGTISVADFNLAVDNGRGQNKKTDFFRVEAWRGLADVASKYIRKGARIIVEGEIHSDPYTKQDGTKATAWQVTASNIEIIDWPPKEETQAAPAPAAPQGYAPVEPQGYVPAPGYAPAPQYAAPPVAPAPVAPAPALAAPPEGYGWMPVPDDAGLPF